MSEYLDLISIFFNEKHLFLTDKKHNICNDCSDHKKFIENNAEIIMSCGDPSSDKSKCGNKIRIILPIYKSDKDLRYFKIKLNEMINWENISKFINIDPKLIKDNQEILEQYNKEIDKLKELFNKYNSDNYKKIQENYSKNKDLKLECKKLLEDIKQSDDIKINELKKEYINNSENINTLFREIKDINMNEYYLMDDPKILVKDLDFIVKQPIAKKKNKMTKEEEGTANYGILYIMYKINKDKQIHLQDMYDMKEELRRVTNLFSGDDESFKSNIRARLRTGDHNMVSDGLVDHPSKGYYKITEKGLRYLENFEKKSKNKKDKKNKKEVKDVKDVKDVKQDSGKLSNGSKVKWEKNGKEFNGIIEGETAKSYRICCKDGKESGEKGSTWLVPKNLVKLS